MLVLINRCRRCRGALTPEADELRCLQCGGRCYPRPAVMPAPPLPEPLPYSPANPRRRNAWTALANYHDHLLRTDQKWWVRNAEVIRRLDAGEPVKVIAAAVGKTPRYVRLLREQLRDLRLSESAA